MPLVQSTLADALGVSRIPVREALQYLASEGVVTFTDEGARVTSLSAAELHELWTFRALIEPALAEAIVRHVSPSELSLLRELVEAMEEPADGDEWSDLNYVFHTELYRIARLPYFAGAAKRVLTLLEPYSRVAVNRLEGQPAAQAEHREMIAALEERDVDRLREVLERHNTRVRKLLVDYAEASSDAGSRSNATAEAARMFAARLYSARDAVVQPQTNE